MDRHLRNFVLRRLLQIPVVMFIVSIIVFYVIHLPQGGPEDLIAGRATEEALQNFKVQYQLDEPLYVQYLIWIKKLFSGSLGTSIYSQEPVSSIIISRVPVSVILGVLSVMLAVLIALPAGYISAVEQYTWKDHTATVLAFIGLSIPNFFLAIVLIRIFSVDLGLLPISVGGDLFVDWVETAKVFVLPTVSLGTALAAHTTRILRSSMLDVFSQDYVRVARTKGIPRGVVNRTIVFKNALIPVITIVALQMGYVLGATVVIEQVFALPGVGRLMLDSVLRRDYSVMQSVVLLYAFVFLMLNLTADVLYGFIDPRIRYEGERK